MVSAFATNMTTKLLIVIFTANTTALLLPAAEDTQRISQPVVVNAASSLAGPVAPGEIIAISDPNAGIAFSHTGLREDQNAADSPDGVSVLFDGIAPRILYTAPLTTTVIVPDSAVPGTSVRLQVASRGRGPVEVVLPVAPAAPGVFTQNSSGHGPALVLNHDLTVNEAARPALKGSVVSFYVTGAGLTMPVAIQDSITSSAVQSRPVLPVAVHIDGRGAEILESVTQSGQNSSVIEIKARIPETLTSHGALSLAVSIGQAISQPGITVFVADQAGAEPSVSTVQSERPTMAFLLQAKTPAQNQTTTDRPTAAAAQTAPRATTSDPGFTPAGAGAVTRPMAEKLQEFVSVKDFGACGNNSCDDTAAIQAAIDASSSNLWGRGLYFPSGVYKTTRPLYTKYARFRMFSHHAKISYVPQAPSTAALVVNSPSLIMEIDGIDFAGPGAVGGNIAIDVTGGVMALTITHCAFYDWGPAAIRITRGDTQSLSITHNVFWSIPGNAIDISTVTDDLEIAHNNFQAGVKTAISIDHAVGASALLINHNDFLTTGGAIILKDVSFVTIQNNEFEQDDVANTNAHSTLIDILGGPSISARIRLLNNTLNANSRASLCVYVADNIYNSTFENNNLTNYTLAGFRVGSGLGNVYVQNFGSSPSTIYNSLSASGSAILAYAGSAATFSGPLSAAPGGTVPTRVAVPATKTAPCQAGAMSWDTNYLYLCSAVNNWIRFAKDTLW